MTARSKVALVAAAYCLAFGPPASAAESVFRCGNSYAQVPCADAQVVKVDDSRSDSQRAAAAEVAAREAKLAAQMTRDREQAEAQAALPRPKSVRTKRLAGNTAPQPGQARRVKGKAVGAEEKVFVVLVPKAAKKTSN